MRHADLLACLRKPGRTDEQVREILEALASPFHADDPTCEALDRCINTLQGNEDELRAVSEMHASDLDERRYSERGEFDSQTQIYPFLTREAA